MRSGQTKTTTARQLVGDDSIEQLSASLLEMAFVAVAAVAALEVDEGQMAGH